MGQIYDAGHPPIVFNMAVELKKLLIDNTSAVKLRGSHRFSTYDDDHNERTISPSEKLIARRLCGDPPVLEVRPQFYSAGLPIVNLPFRDWWNRDVIYRASAALPGTPVGRIPMDRSARVPYDERSKTIGGS
jgi:hypothetical protein